MQQLKLFKSQSKAYGGKLYKTRRGRSGPRPLSSRDSMHFVLKSNLARGPRSLRSHRNKVLVHKYIEKFSAKYHVKVISYANVGNHLHIHLKLGTRHTYNAFIRALTGSIARSILLKNPMVMPTAKSIQQDDNLEQNKKASRVNRDEPTDASCKTKNSSNKKTKFWDYRPFSRVITGYKSFLNVSEYMEINRLEGSGVERFRARQIVKNYLITKTMFVRWGPHSYI